MRARMASPVVLGQLLVAVLGAVLLPRPAIAQSGSPDAPAAPIDDARLKALESEVDLLKEKIFKSKARLLLLQETVLHGAAAGAIAKISFRNDMGGAYRLESATWVLDGQTIFREGPDVGTAVGQLAAAGADAGAGTTGPLALADRKQMTLFDGAIVPGSHSLSVTLVYRGSGYQVFSYLEGYRFTLQSNYAFLVEEGKTTELTVAAYPKDGLTAAYEDRLDLKFQVSTSDSVPVPPGEEAP